MDLDQRIDKSTGERAANYAVILSSLLTIALLISDMTVSVLEHLGLTLKHVLVASGGI